MSKELREAEQRDALYAVDQSQSQGGEQGGATHVIPTDRGFHFNLIYTWCSIYRIIGGRSLYY